MNVIVDGVRYFPEEDLKLAMAKEAAANERAQLYLNAKDGWRSRALAAEAELANAKNATSSTQQKHGACTACGDTHNDCSALGKRCTSCGGPADYMLDGKLQKKCYQCSPKVGECFTSPSGKTYFVTRVEETGELYLKEHQP